MKKAVKESQDDYRMVGKTTIAPQVLVTIARLTALEVPGVSRTANIPRSAHRILARDAAEGVRIDIQDDHVFVDLYLVMNADVNFLETGRLVQAEVARSISEMVGMQIGQVNIHVEDIDFSPESDTTP